MTTKLKIILGFTLMVAIVAVVSIIGYRGLGNASRLFAEYYRTAILNTALSDSLTGLQESAYYLEKFMRLSGDKDMDASLAAQRKTLAGVEKALGEIVRPERRQVMEKIRDRLREYVEVLGQLKTAFGPWYGDYLRIITPNFEEAGKSLGEVGDMALRVNNSAILGQVNDVWRMLVSLDKALTHFRQTATRERAAEIEALLERDKALNESFRASLTTDEGKRSFAVYQSKVD